MESMWQVYVQRGSTYKDVHCFLQQFVSPNTNINFPYQNQNTQNTNSRHGNVFYIAYTLFDRKVILFDFATNTHRQLWNITSDAWWRHQMETFSALLAPCAGNSPGHKGQWRGALMFSLICAWTNAWVNNREAGDLRRHRSHYDVIVMG